MVRSSVEVRKMRAKLWIGKFTLHMHNVSMVDVSGMYALEELHQECAKKSIVLELCGLSENVHAELKKFGITALIQK